MSKSDDNTNELDSYGVWVRSTPGKDQSELDSQGKDIENQEEQKEDLELDLPDFDDTEFSDMFRSEPEFSMDNQDDDFGSDFDSTLSTDELANITGLGDVAIENVDAAAELEDFDSDFSDVNNEEEEISLDEFMDDGFSDESVASGNNGYEPGAEKKNSSETEEVSLDDFFDDEESLDSIIGDDSSPKIEEDEAPIDMDITFDDSADNVETEENSSLEEEGSYDMEDIEIEDIDTNDKEPETAGLEAVDDFSSIISDIEEPEHTSSPTEEVNLDTEDIDLSDFGIDTDAEETPIVQDVEDQKGKDKVVDYDLFVENDEAASAPVINEIKNEVPEETPAEAPKATTAVDTDLLRQIVEDLSNLKNEISSIKTNIAEMKSQKEALQKMPEHEEENLEKPDDSMAADEDETIVDVDVVEETATNEIPFPDLVIEDEVEDENVQKASPVEEEKIGDYPDTDDTIVEASDALAEEDSGIENAGEPDSSDIMETEDVTEEFNLPDNIEEPADLESLDDEDKDLVFEDDQLDDIFVSEEDSDVSLAAEDGEGGFFSADDTDETIALSGDELSNIMNNADFGSNVDFADEADDIAEDTLPSDIDIDNITENSDVFEPGESGKDIDFDYSHEVLEEPDINELSIESEEPEENLPEEINIPKDNDIFVESTSSDFMDSVKDTTEDSLMEDSGLSPIEDIDEVTELEDELPTTDSILEENEVDADDGDKVAEAQDIPTVEQLVNKDEELDNSSADDTFDDVDFLDNKAVNTEPDNKESITDISDEDDADDDFLEVDNLNNELSTSNINYLTAKDENTEDFSDDKSCGVNNDLKQEIKSVLLYMDQLLENLPEEKIYEFAKSDEFATYKKLFKDLGLS